MKVSIFDPGVPNEDGSPMYNLGNRIIQNAVTREIREVLGEAGYVRIDPHIPMKPGDLRAINQSDYVFIGGSNLLGNRVFIKRKLKWWSQWKISYRQARQITNAILLGVGWRRYEGRTGFYTKAIIRAALSRDMMHSVRDEYTKEKLKAIGIENVINTGCPTTWPLASLKSEEIPLTKSDNVLFMLTDYKKRHEMDVKLIDILISNYKKVFFWPQGASDLVYLKSLGKPVEILDNTLELLDAFMNEHREFDYVGTRLHGGIHCLLAKKRALILRIDNRATELAKTTGLTTAERDDYDSILKWINGSVETRLHINTEAIRAWKEQFSHKK